jgi:hypothetical protein
MWREWWYIKYRITRALQWLHACPECGVRPDRHWHSMAPRFDSDKVIAMFKEHGVVYGERCGRCAAPRSRPTR